MTSSLFWDVSQCLFVAICRRFETTSYSDLQGLSVSRGFTHGLVDRGRWEQVVVPKRRLIATNKG